MYICMYMYVCIFICICVYIYMVAQLSRVREQLPVYRLTNTVYSL